MTAARGAFRWVARSARCGIAALFAGIVVAATLEAHRLEAERAVLSMEVIMSEDRAVCARLAASQETSTFARCAVELAWVRSEERRRTIAELATWP